MAKPKKGNQGGISNDKIRHVHRVIEDSRASAKTFTDGSNETVNAFGDDGGHKGAIRSAAKLSRLEPKDFADFWRNLEHYCDVLGLFDQEDMIDPLPRRGKAPAMPASPESFN